MSNNVLTVERQWQTSNNQTTFLRNEKGLVVKIITNPLQQPKKSHKTITIKGKEYQLKFQ
jgi:hypothetical protein